MHCLLCRSMRRGGLGWACQDSTRDKESQRHQANLLRQLSLSLEELQGQLEAEKGKNKVGTSWL